MYQLSSQANVTCGHHLGPVGDLVVISDPTYPTNRSEIESGPSGGYRLVARLVTEVCLFCLRQNDSSPRLLFQ
ncbi:hypothetical protein RRG08_025954 [Elysia crispata]|uniref:Uncharacterized protein n=1 Tax=Elysia crispata TaxID=231223 RepID=A0AAE0ZG42_9GAST|nr:hypothetical protein RRG08_025954 [Elysia crispata]